MNIDKNQLALTQLAILIFASMALLSRSALIPWIVVVLGLALAFSVGTVLAIVNRIYANQSNDKEHQYSAVLGTHLGGAICYAITISFIFHNLS